MQCAVMEAEEAAEVIVITQHERTASKYEDETDAAR
jgi:hypothetical protein